MLVNQLYLIKLLVEEYLSTILLNKFDLPTFGLPTILTTALFIQTPPYPNYYNTKINSFQHLISIKKDIFSLKYIY